MYPKDDCAQHSCDGVPLAVRTLRQMQAAEDNTENMAIPDSREHGSFCNMSLAQSISSRLAEAATLGQPMPPTTPITSVSSETCFVPKCFSCEPFVLLNESVAACGQPLITTTEPIGGKVPSAWTGCSCALLPHNSFSKKLYMVLVVAMSYDAQCAGKSKALSASGAQHSTCSDSR